jgi:hypothetical protein
MKHANSFAFALLLGACQEEEPTMTFGLALRALGTDRPAELAQPLCSPPGAYDGSTTGVSIDVTEIGELPQLMLEAEPDAEENVYRVRLYVLEREPGQIWWEPGEILAERSYDGDFGERGEQDSFVVDFDGEQYTVEVLGLPAATPCPEQLADSGDVVR